MADRASNPDALEQAAQVLRHRLFPRAMAWNVHHQTAGPTAEEIVMAAAQVLEQQQQQNRVDPMNVARSFPLLQASIPSRGEEKSFHRALTDARPATPPPIRRTASVTDEDDRERLFRTMGKYLGGSAPPDPYNRVQSSQGYTQSQVYYQPPPLPIRRPHGGMPSPERMTAEQQAAFQAMKISSYVEEEHRSWNTQSQVVGGLRTPPLAVSPTPPGIHQIQLRSPPSATSGKKRTRGSTPELGRTGSTAVGKDEIAPSLARALLTGCGAKQCSFEGCKKIAVSKGLCRGHGGGRRCQHSGCTKCAQSRSPFCWAHGGGKRCEAPNCRRSRKTKRFCVDHVEMEDTVPEVENIPKPASSRAAKTKSTASSGKTSSSSYASADSDDSVGRQSTISCDSNFSAAHNKENKRMPSAEYEVREKYVQYHQYAGEVSGNPPPSLQLPSLNEALLRTVPTQQTSEAMWSSTRTPSPPAPQYKSGYRSWPAK
ncbi:putative WRKY transcription factor 19 [Phytophthora citrophthora]|uniref:WRKY transcription factor 19 n=1 Tax=Phytophthora citrophthora TaxID=4793 RepID=A0AAD9G4A7_9STRA|nr:putative WRKY transcription factor 19 [Phytophthora citrophthora]